MAKVRNIMLLISIICTSAIADPGVHTIRIRFPGPSSDKIVLPQSAKQEIAPYPPAGLKPELPFELPEPTYLPPVEPDLTYGPPEVVYGLPAETYGPPEQKPALTYGSPEPELIYGPPADTYGPPDFNDIQSETIVNAPLRVTPQFTQHRPNNAANFQPINTRPQAAAIINAPLRPVNYLTLPRYERIVAFRPKRPQTQGQNYFPATYLTLPRVERLIEFRPKRISNQRPTQHQSNNFKRPLPSSIFSNSNRGHSGRQLPSNIFSN